MLIVIIVAILVIFVTVVVSTLMRNGDFGVNIGSVKCGHCGQQLPQVRVPASLRQALWGGVTCSNCGVELDKWGMPVGN